MSVSVIQKLSSSFTDSSLPKLYRDSIINSGTKFCFDFLNAYCNPNPDGAIASNATFNNLVDSAPVATSTTANLTNVTGKAGINNAASSAQVTLGGVASYDMSTLNHEFLLCFWFKLNSTYNSSAYYSPFGYTTSNNNTAQWIFDMGSAGLTPRFSVGTGSSADTVQSSTNVSTGTIYQVAGHWKPGVSVDIYLNGALNNSLTTSVVSTLQGVSGVTPNLMQAMKGTIYRCWMEDLTASGNTPLGQVSADYTGNSARFT